MLDQESIHIDEIIAKYLSKNASEDETKTLEQWVLDDKQNKAHFIEMKKAWMLSGIKQTDTSNNTEKAWENLSKQLFEASSAKVIPLFKRQWAVAASLVLLVLSGWLIYQFVGQPTTFTAETSTNAALYQLADGSKIILNQQSALSFETIESNRIATLEGDAYFDVARDEQQPFIVKTNNIQIKVLGTAFYVDSRKNQSETQVIVEEGKVAVSYNSQSVILTAGDKAVFEKSSGKLVKVINEDKNFNSLKTNVLQFENTNLSEVAYVLNRQFNIEVSLENQQLKNCQLNAVFKDKSMPSIIKVIESTLGVKMNQTGNNVVISGNCK